MSSEESLTSKFIKRRKNYSTTSSIFVDFTLFNQEPLYILKSISYILESQLYEDTIMQSSNSYNVLFDLDSDENATNTEFVELADISRFLNGVFNNINNPNETNIIAFIYLNRMIKMANICLSKKNWQPIWLVCLLLACKVWSDQKMKTEKFTQLIPNLTKKKLLEMEREVLNLIKFNVSIHSGLYAEYYFDLRAAYEFSLGVKPDDVQLESIWTLKPLTISQAKRLEIRSNLNINKFKKETKNETPTTLSSRTYEDIGADLPEKSLYIIN